jgi:Cu+-exporting ATPase
MPKETCYHCGAECNKDTIVFNGKPFCCNGCKTVYEILNQNELSCYYDLDQTPGTIPTEIKGKYDYLDNEEIAEKIIEFNDGTTSVVNFYIPSIHCSSCIWVLENLDKLNKGVKASIVNFPKKEARITFKNEEISLKQVVELMTSIGYEPNINLESAEKSKLKIDRTLIYQVAIAGFAFGNIMLYSFPGYFEIDEFWLNRFKPLFRLLMFIFSIPVVIYSAKDYFISAYKGLKHNILNIDVPISLGILVLFFRSSYEIFTHTGQGYFDSLSGLVFFLLLGKVFQQKTYSFLSFERDYKSYFPIAITRIDPKDNSHHSIAVHNIEQGDRLLIRNEEIIPVDGILISGNALLDYSFVTGESLPVLKNSGDKIFAGGKQTNGAIEMEALQTVTQSYLTQLWSNDIFSKTSEKNIKSLTDKMSKYFTIIILGIAFISGAYWYFIDKNTAFNVVTAVLIIACPCALALSAPFAFGNMLRIFGKNKFYLKNTDVIENISRIDTMAFDKTGTITTNRNTDITYKGEKLSESDTGDIKSLLRSSNHPLSRILFNYLPGNANKTITDFKEILGKGLEGKIDGKLIRLGSANYLNIEDSGQMNTFIYIETNGNVRGKFIFHNAYREGLKELFGELSKDYGLAILSGDNAGEKETLEKVLPSGSEILFNQKPEDKLKYIKHLQEEKEHVMMFGDGLNDAGALAQSNVGIAISENINVFSPACDGILDASQFENLPKFLQLSKGTIKIIKISFVFSFLYNIIGMYFAVRGNLSPIIAAILMPISSISVVTFVTLTTSYISKKVLHS